MARRKIWVHKARSFEDAAKFEEIYYQTLSRTERVATMQWLRDSFERFKKGRQGAKNRKRLRRIVTIVQ